MLKRRWGLPDAAAPVLERFFTSWAAGHTSLELTHEEAGLLAGSAAVTTGSDGRSPAPLVLRGTRLQSWRLDQAETRVAARLRELASEHVQVPAGYTPNGAASPEEGSNTPGPGDADDLAQLFPDSQSAQRRAAELGLRRALALVDRRSRNRQDHHSRAPARPARQPRTRHPRRTGRTHRQGCGPPR